jgi:hypothetical protein
MKIGTDVFPVLHLAAIVFGVTGSSVVVWKVANHEA